MIENEYIFIKNCIISDSRNYLSLIDQQKLLKIRIFVLIRNNYCDFIYFYHHFVTLSEILMSLNLSK